MEMRDVYHRDGTPMGRSIEKHDKLEKGWYLLHAIVILKMMDGRYIMQQRSLEARHYPGQWDVTGGGVMSGESSAHAAAREAEEELGVTVDPENLKLMLREVTEWGEDRGMICDTYAARVDVREDGFALNRWEVNDVRCVDFDTFFSTVIYNKSEAFAEMLKRVEREI